MSNESFHMAAALAQMATLLPEDSLAEWRGYYETTEARTAEDRLVLSALIQEDDRRAS